MGKTVDRRQLARQNSQIGATEQTNLLLATIVALLEQHNEALGYPPIEPIEEESVKTKRGLFG